MIKEMEIPVWWNDRKFLAIVALGFTEEGKFHVELYSCPPPKPRGWYSCFPPISPREFRNHHPRNPEAGGWEFQAIPGSVMFTDDWGEAYKISSSQEVVDVLVKEFEEQGFSESNTLWSVEELIHEENS